MATEKQLRNNSEYWKKRFQLLEERNHDKADKLSEKLRKEYAKAEKEIEKLTYEWYGRIAANNEVSMDEARRLLKGAELSEFKWTVDQYIEVGSKENLSPAWIKQLENASARAHTTRLDAQKVYLRNTIENLYGKEERLVKSGLMETYEDNLYRTAFEIEKGCGVGVNFAKADTRRIEAVINRPWAQDVETFSDRIWDSKAALATELETQLMQNVMLGRSNEEAVKAIEKRFGVSYRQADRLIRTETAAIASQAQQEAFKELDVEKYEIVATLDNRTSEICQEMDGKVFDMKDYEVGTTAPPFHPNCRSCTAPYLEDDYGETIHRVARDEEGKSSVLSQEIKYSEWKKLFIEEGEDRLKLAPQNAKINKKVKDDKQLRLLNKLKKHGVAYKEPNPLADPLTDEEIIDKVSKDDDCDGACSSVALAYIGNLLGFDVTDFRGGYSTDAFALTKNIIEIANYANGRIITEYSDFRAADLLLREVNPGKLYYFTAGEHAAIVRKQGTTYEYLDLQSLERKGWHELTYEALEKRFKCQKARTQFGSKAKDTNVLIDVDNFKDAEEFKNLLGYINTN